MPPKPRTPRPLATRGRVLGELHPHTLSVRNNLAQVLAGLDRPAEAERHLRVVLDGRVRLLGDDDPLTASTRHGLRLPLSLSLSLTTPRDRARPARSPSGRRAPPRCASASSAAS
ncbi:MULTISPECIES: tetratricopeptide repeat protein [Actinoalloteichus]|uniref:tetratricopeptide repeat protein n=1 Tax=Actinoalloteichus TaxID=65496 RepID=UPI0009FA0299|nr:MULTISPECIES: tetratricopeptide repeat protein [Actinoalloteichus]